MDLRIDKEWFERRSKAEADHEVSAGLRRYMHGHSVDEIVQEVSGAFGARLRQIMEGAEVQSAEDLLDRLAREGGCIVSSGSASELEIADARVRGDFYVDERGLGFILRSKQWLDRVHKMDGYMQPSG